MTPNAVSDPRPTRALPTETSRAGARREKKAPFLQERRRWARNPPRVCVAVALSTSSVCVPQSPHGTGCCAHRAGERW